MSAESGRRWYREHRELSRQHSQEYYFSHKKEMLAKARQYWLKNRDKRLARRRELDALLKLEVLAYYSRDGKAECSFCGMADIDVLNIDHVNGGGRKHREEISGNALGQNLYRWLKREGFPSGYQTLCANCNLKKAIEVKRRERRQL